MTTLTTHLLSMNVCIVIAPRSHLHSGKSTYIHTYYGVGECPSSTSTRYQANMDLTIPELSIIHKQPIHYILTSNRFDYKHECIYIIDKLEIDFYSK